jgi:tetratricopeptide (TPR) repeat protein
VKIFSWYWDDVLGKIISTVENYIGYELIEPYAPTIVKSVVTFLIFLFLYEIYLRIRKFWRSRKFISESTPVVLPSSETVDKKSEFIQELESLKAPQQTIERLKKEKKYNQLGEVYVSMQKYKEAGWAFQKAGMLKRAATEYAKAGKTTYAAKLLLKANEPSQAAQLLVGIGKTGKAARWLERKGISDTASFLWWESKYYKKAVSLWLKLLDTLSTHPEERRELCNKIIQQIYKTGLTNIPEKYKKPLLEALSQQMILEKRYDLAIDLLKNCGEHQKAQALLQQLSRNP